jgi:hypothetical protein
VNSRELSLPQEEHRGQGSWFHYDTHPRVLGSAGAQKRLGCLGDDAAATVPHRPKCIPWRKQASSHHMEKFGKAIPSLTLSPAA